MWIAVNQFKKKKKATNTVRILNRTKNFCKISNQKKKDCLWILVNQSQERKEKKWLIIQYFKQNKRKICKMSNQKKKEKKDCFLWILANQSQERKEKMATNAARVSWLIDSFCEKCFARMDGNQG